MASLDELPADQRAVLQMVLQRGRSYDEIANLLSIDRSAVRQRALDACDALTADGINPGPEQALVTDYLLSQLPEQVAGQVYIYLETADDDREWADAIADRLAPLASKPLPDVPVAAPLRSDQPAVVDVPDMPHERPASMPAAPAPARKRLLIGGLSFAAVILAVGLVALLTSNGSSPPKPRRIYTHTPTGKTTTRTNTGPQILGALNLTSPVGATQTLGVAQVVRDDGVVGIVIDAQGVPANSSHNAYGVWLYNSATSNKFVGFDPNLVGSNEKLAIEGPLPTDAGDFKRLLITLETRQHPKAPGEVVLAGDFSER
jgi:Sigma-70, region 4